LAFHIFDGGLMCRDGCILLFYFKTKYILIKAKSLYAKLVSYNKCIDCGVISSSKEQKHTEITQESEHSFVEEIIKKCPNCSGNNFGEPFYDRELLRPLKNKNL
jgi:hypothetical protein